MTTRPSTKKTRTGKRIAKNRLPKTVDAPSYTRQWIIVADHRQVHVYQKTPKGIQRVPEECLHCALPTPGGEPDDDLFLQDLAAWLDEAVEEDIFDRIAIIAAPKALKCIHPLLDKKVHARVCAAMAKDVEKITEEEIEDHLTEVVWM
jgi:hypothetical protein